MYAAIKDMMSLISARLNALHIDSHNTFLFLRRFPWKIITKGKYFSLILLQNTHTYLAFLLPYSVLYFLSSPHPPFDTIQVVNLHNNLTHSTNCWSDLMMWHRKSLNYYFLNDDSWPVIEFSIAMHLPLFHIHGYLLFPVSVHTYILVKTPRYDTYSVLRVCLCSSSGGYTRLRRAPY